MFTSLFFTNRKLISLKKERLHVCPSVCVFVCLSVMVCVHTRLVSLNQVCPSPPLLNMCLDFECPILIHTNTPLPPCKKWGYKENKECKECNGGV